MGAHIYKKTKRINVRKVARFSGLGLILLGLLFALYTLSPLLSWQLYLKPAFANTNFASPIPQTTVLTKDTLASLLQNSFQRDWLPTVYQNAQVGATVTNYTLTIPELDITNADVSTVDTDIGSHLIHFPGTVMPPGKGNAVIFGHSTLPQLYDRKNYKTIFANIHNLKVGNKFLLTINNTIYTYSIVSLSIVDATDTSYLTQYPDDSYLTIVTCTPPGTTWKRLVIKSRLEKITDR